MLILQKVDVAETRTANIDLLTYSETKIAMSANSVNLSLGNVFTKTYLWSNHTDF